MMQKSVLTVASDVWEKMFRPPCYGNSVKCPVLFTKAMYECKHNKDCEKATLKAFRENMKRRAGGEGWIIDIDELGKKLSVHPSSV